MLDTANLVAYEEVLRTAHYQQREIFADCFVRCLSGVVEPDAWIAALKNAANMVQNIRPLPEMTNV